MNLVALSSLLGEVGFLVLHEETNCLGGEIHVVAGVGDSRRGNLGEGPYSITYVEILLTNAARTCPRLSGAPGNGKSVIAHPHSFEIALTA
jgi:hypothetical protein